MRLTILIFSAFLAACGSKNSTGDLPVSIAPNPNCQAPSFQASQHRIVSFGDSNTAGIVDLVQGCPYAYEYKMANDYQFNLVNLAIGGSRIDMPGQLPTALATQLQPTDIVTFIAGYNDSRVWGINSNHLFAFEADLSDFITFAAFKAQLVMIGTTPQMSFYSGPEASPAAQAMYAQAVRDVVAQLDLPNVILVDVAEIKWQSDDFEPDLVHFTPASQNRIAALFETQMPQGE